MYAIVATEDAARDAVTALHAEGFDKGRIIEAREFQEAAVRGDVVLAVKVTSIDEQARAARVLATHGGERITTIGGESHPA